jgi:hypothetical protein
MYIQMDSSCFVYFASDLCPLLSPTITKPGPQIRSIVHNLGLLFVLCKPCMVYVESGGSSCMVVS